MIELTNISKEEPYLVFKSLFDKSLKENQKNAEAFCIASHSSHSKEVDARFVNLKFINGKEFIFFSNYNSPKSKDFSACDQITAVTYWSSINVQIRMKAIIKKTNVSFNKKYFAKRNIKKNAIAISSNQSKPVESFSQVKENYNKSLKNDDLKKCPEYWGGFSFTPYHFEFWEGHESRINKREIFEKIDGVWEQSFLQP